MLIYSATILCLIALANTATIQQRNIPVEVRYDEPAVDINSVRNLNEKIQLSPAELKAASEGLTEVSEEELEETVEIEEKRTSAINNLEEKVQLSPEELGQALKHLPVQHEEILSAEESAPLKNLGELPKIEEITQEPYTSNIQHVLQKAEDIISNGLKKLKLSFKPSNDEQGPNPQQWDDLEKAVSEYLSEQKIKLQLKQEQSTTSPQNQNFFQNIASGFQTIANNFLQTLSGTQASNTNPTNQADEQQGGPLQGFINYFQGGVNNIVNAINGLGSQGATTSNTVLGDIGTGSTTQAPGFISNFVSNVQQFLGNIQSAAQGVAGSTGTQGDTGVNSTVSSRPPGPAQVIQSIGSAINNFIQGTRPPNAPGDEGTATTEASNSNIIQSIGSAIQNSPFNPFRPQTQKPGDSGAATQNPIQAGIAGVQNLGTQIQQLVSGQGSTTEGSKKPEDEAPAVQNNQGTEEPVQKDVNGEVEKVETTGNSEENKQEEQKQEEAEEIKQEEEQQASQEETTQEEVKQEEAKQEETKQEDKKEETQEGEKQEGETQEEVKQEEDKQELVKEEENKQEEVKEESTTQEDQKQEETKQEEVEHKEELLLTSE